MKNSESAERHNSYDEEKDHDEHHTRELWELGDAHQHQYQGEDTNGKTADVPEPNGLLQTQVGDGMDHRYVTLQTGQAVEERLRWVRSGDKIVRSRPHGQVAGENGNTVQDKSNIHQDLSGSHVVNKDIIVAQGFFSFVPTSTETHPQDDDAHGDDEEVYGGQSGEDRQTECGLKAKIEDWVEGCVDAAAHVKE